VGGDAGSNSPRKSLADPRVCDSSGAVTTVPAPVRRALVSVSDKTNLEALSRALVAHGIEVLSTGGTYAALKALGVPALKVSEYTGAPEILGGRVKTLHPKIHGGILALPSEQHQQELANQGYGTIDLVVVNLYPFSSTIARPEATFDDAVENIDIGGPTMIRAAAKNWQRVAVVVDPTDYDALVQALEEHQGSLPESFRRKMSRKAFAHTAAYDAAIANYLGTLDERGAPRSSAEMPSDIFLAGHALQSIRYGENPHQAAAFYRFRFGPRDPAGLDACKQLQGKPLSYNNLLDADAALALIRDLSAYGPAAAVFKHVSPCGAAVGAPKEPLAEVFVRAREADAESAFGGIVALSEVVDESTAARLVETFLEVVIAPGYSERALEILAAKKNFRVLELAALKVAPGTTPALRVRSVAGGFLVQREDVISVDSKQAKLVTRAPLMAEDVRSVDVGICVCKHVRSNAIVIVRDGVTIGIGGGQTSRVEAVRQALARAGDLAVGAVVASDAFFPFADSIQLLAQAGIRAVVQPGGSMRDEEVVEAANAAGLVMLFTGERHFRH
jgi:phosphoribosylaminoimidazolecarboxamide formyltransferase/IMP cyclohydrolase